MLSGYKSTVPHENASDKSDASAFSSTRTFERMPEHKATLKLGTTKEFLIRESGCWKEAVMPYCSNDRTMTEKT